jgi:hypothetical protein
MNIATIDTRVISICTSCLVLCFVLLLKEQQVITLHWFYYVLLEVHCFTQYQHGGYRCGQYRVFQNVINMTVIVTSPEIDLLSLIDS